MYIFGFRVLGLDNSGQIKSLKPSRKSGYMTGITKPAQTRASRHKPIRTLQKPKPAKSASKKVKVMQLTHMRLSPRGKG